MSASISYGSIEVVRGDIQNSERTAQFSSWFSWKGMGNWIVELLRKKPIQQFTRLYVELEGLHKIVIDLETISDNPQKDYKVFSGMVNILTRTNSLYRGVDYMDSEQLEKLMNETLSLSYEIEAELKIRALSSTPRIATDDNFKKALSFNSRFAITHRLSIQK